MALTPSTMLPLGTQAPDFQLPDVSGKTVRLADFQGAPALVVMFICNHCPYVKHLRSALAAFGKSCQSKGVAVVAISSNDPVGYPDDSLEKMVVEALDSGYVFPYLFHESQAIAKAYQAACTPDFYVFDRDQKLVYRGQYDDSRPGNASAITGADLQGAVDAVLTGRPVSATQKPSIGCNIKWKPGNAPPYFG